VIGCAVAVDVIGCAVAVDVIGCAVAVDVVAVLWVVVEVLVVVGCAEAMPATKSAAAAAIASLSFIVVSLRDAGPVPRVPAIALGFAAPDATASKLTNLQIRRAALHGVGGVAEQM